MGIAFQRLQMATDTACACWLRGRVRWALLLIGAILCADLHAQVITTFAGGGIGDGAPATNAMMSQPVGLARDASGNIYVAELTGHRVRKITPGGVITTLAGTGTAGFSGDGGQATSANLNGPYDVAVDAGGNVFIADLTNHRIRKVDPSGIITTYVGSGTAGFGGDGGPATSANLNSPSGVAFDSSGNLFISDTTNHRIRRVSASGVISTIAGNGTATFAGDGGPATSASLSSPNRVAVDTGGNVFVADYGNHRIRRVSSGGTITTLAGNGAAGFGGDNGPATSGSLYYPHSAVVDAAGNLYIGDGNQRIRKVNSSGVITTVAGNGTTGFNGDGGPAANANFNGVTDVELDASGNIYVADLSNHRVRRVVTGGTISTFAGNGETTFAGDGGPAAGARLQSPTGVRVDGNGNVFIADYQNFRIRKVSTNGVIVTVAGNGISGFNGDGGPATNASMARAQKVSFDGSGNIYFPEDTNNRIRKVDSNGIISTFAGNGAATFSGDNGPATSASLYYPTDAAVDSNGNVFIADFNNVRIRKVSSNGTITTFAGNGSISFGGDNGPATSASLRSPASVAFDGSGNVLIADQIANRVRMVSSNGTITTIAGNGTEGFGGDNGPATSASLFSPVDIAVDGGGNIFIADWGNHRVRKINAAGIISTVAGNGTPGYGGDGGTATTALLNYPNGVGFDANGNLYIADASNHRIRKVSQAASVAPVITSAVPTGGIFGVAYNHTYSATGFPAPTYSVTAGGLPSGLLVSTAGMVSGTPTAAGTFTGTVTASNGIGSGGAQAFSITIAKAAQAITFTSLPARIFGAAPFPLSATGGASGNPVTFTSTTPGVCSTGSTNGATVTLVAAGVCTIAANQAGNSNYDAAPQVGQSFSVAKASQSIVFVALASRTLAEAPFPVTATGGGSGNPVTFTSTTSGVCATGGINGATVTLLAPGGCQIAANQAGNGNFDDAPQVTRSFSVAKASQSIVFGALAGRTLGEAPFPLSATGGGSGNPVTFASITSAVCTTGGTNGATVTMVSTGTCTVAANQAGNSNYDAALQVTQSFTVGRPPGGPSIATSATHTLALDINGKVYGWGSDNRGQLGLGRKITQPAPVAVSGLPIIDHISISRHALAVDANLQVWSWGDNACGQLGPREATVTTTPSRVLGATRMTKVAAGLCFSLGLKEDGTVWAWGSVPGYTGTGIRRLTGLSGIIDIAAGSRHALAQTSTGLVFALGDNLQGQLGIASTGAAQAAVQVPGVSGVAAIAAGDVSSMVKLVNGDVRFWGKHADGTLITSALTLTGLGVAESISVTGNRPYVAHADGSVLGYGATSASWAAEFTGFSGIKSVTAGNSVVAGNLRFALGINASGQLFAAGNNTGGQLGQNHTNSVAFAVQVPGFGSTKMVRTGALDSSVLALKGDGSVWFWGADTSGESGDGTLIGTSVPRVTKPMPVIESIAAGDGFSAAVDTSGNVWAWGDNTSAVLGSSRVSRSEPAVIPVGGSPVLAIAAGGQKVLAYLLADGSVWFSGTLPLITATLDPAPIAGFSNIRAIAVGDNNVYGVRADGVVLAVGENDAGELGNNSLAPSATPVTVQGISGFVIRIAATRFRAGAVTSDGRVYMWGSGPLGNGTSGGSLIAVQVPGITDAVDISVGTSGTMVLRQNGGIFAWGDLNLAEAPANKLVPYSITLPTARLARAGRGSTLAFALGSTGLAWGFGRYGTLSTLGASIGDGTHVPRTRPVVLLAAEGAGNIDNNDWYFDLDTTTTPESIPAASLPTQLGESKLYGGGDGLFVDAKIRYKKNDITNSRQVGNYVLGMVPPVFFDYVKSAPGAPSKAALQVKAAKNGGFVTVHLTPDGWTTLDGRAIAFSQGVANAAGGAANILSNTPPGAIAGAKFCIGYGESLNSMLTAQTLSEVLFLEGVATTVTDVPCVLPGIYMEGPPTSRSGSEVAFNAMVVGISPTGDVQFRDGSAVLPPAETLVPGSAAAVVARATKRISTLLVGAHSVGATYPGDNRNAAAAVDIPLRHVVEAVPPGQSRVTLEGPTGSVRGSVVTFVATVTGNQPAGTVQFKDFGANLEAAVPLVGGVATLRVPALSLALGIPRTITAFYSGDVVRNDPSTSNEIIHRVSLALPTMAFTTNASSVVAGATVRLTATLTGITSLNTPTGSVTFRDGAVAISGAVGLSSGTAILDVSNFDAGQHYLRAEYTGDGQNGPTSSDVVVLDVRLPSVLVPLTVARSGGGSGTVTSVPAGIDCGATCIANFAAGATVTLSAAPASDSLFAGWSGACSGLGACTVNVSAATSVTATFQPFTGQLRTRYRLYSPGTFEHLYTTDFNEYSVLPVCCAWVAEGAIYRIFSGQGSYSGVAAVPYYRLYNPFSFQHHWTTDAGEYNFLPSVGWIQEGTDGYILPTPIAGALPLYRLYLNAAGGLHLWTIDLNERNYLVANAGWIDEGIAGYVIPLP